MLRSSSAGDEALVLGDVHGLDTPRQPSDMLYMPNRPGV